MREILKVILPAIGTCLFVYGVGMAGVIAYDKLFSRKKLKKSRNTESDSGPADNSPPMRDIQCEVCGYKFIPYNDNRYTVVGKHNYGRFHYYNDGAIISDTAIVDGLHDAFSCPMCGCQIVVHLPQHLKFDAAACSSKPYEKASPELIEQLKKSAAFPRPAAPKYCECVGCGFEHKCHIDGCAVMLKAAELLEI